MKHCILICITLLIFSCASTSEEKDDSTANYVPPTTVQHVEHYPSGIKKIEGKLVDGKRHGKWIYYYENGFIWSEGLYKHGIRDGYSLVYYQNGYKKIQGQYEKNLGVGEWKVFSEDGVLLKAIDLNKMLTAKDSVLLELK